MSEDKNSKSKILIVDDVPKNIQVVANILQNQGYSMAFAQDGPTALKMIGSTPFDLILLDIMMPDMDGFEVCQRLREFDEAKDIPVLFLTAKTDTESIVSGFNAGAMDYVFKPINEPELLARVRTHLAHYQSRKDLKAVNARLRKEVAERRQAEQRYVNMYQNAVQGMFQSTEDGRIIRLNPAYVDILGYESAEEVIALEDVSQAFFDPPEQRAKMLAALKKNGILTNYELKIQQKDGTPAWIMVNARLAKDTGGEPIIEGIVIESTAQKQADEELRRSRKQYHYQATHDSLTGLYNTRYLYTALEKLIPACAAKNRPFSLIFMDVDNFKRVVDTYGHLKGSRTLQEMAKTIQDCLAEPAYGVAYGGDEFVIVLPGVDKTQAVEKAMEIRAQIRKTAYLTSYGHEIYISASFGLAAYPSDATGIKELLALADQAMFNVKEDGKDGVGATGE